MIYKLLRIGHQICCLCNLGRRNSNVSMYEEAQEKDPCKGLAAYVKSRMAVPMHKRYKEPASTLQELGWGEEREVRPKPLVMASNGNLQRDSYRPSLHPLKLRKEGNFTNN